MFPNDLGLLSPVDDEVLQHLALTAEQDAFWKQEAIRFLWKPEVRKQIDRVADALQDRTTITNQQLTEISQFTVSLADLE